MNTYMFNSRRLVACISLLALLVVPFTFVGCKEEISADAYAIKRRRHWTIICLNVLTCRAFAPYLLMQSWAFLTMRLL